MPGPWEKYQAAPAAASQDGPWAKYGSQASADMPTMTGTPQSAPAADRVAAINDAMAGDPVGMAVMHALNLASHYVQSKVGKDSNVGKAAQTVADNVIGAPVAMLHHAENIPEGLAQLIAHGAAATGNETAKGVADKLDNAAFEREQTYQSGIPTNVGSVAGATVGEVAPWLAGAGELRAAGALPKATTTMQKVAQLAGEGAAMGAAQPVTEGDSYAKQKAAQIGLGAVSGPVLHGAGKGVGALTKGAQEAVKYVRDPQAIADQYVKSLFGGDPETLAALRNAPQYVQGDTPTAAQAIAERSPNDAKAINAVAAERLLRNNPNTREAFALADVNANKARRQVVDRLAGSDEQIQAAKQSRRDAISPYADEFLTDSRPVVRWTGAQNALKNVLDKPGRMPAADFDALQKAQGIVSKVRGGSMQEDDALEAINELSDGVTTKTAQNAFANLHQAVSRNMVDPSGVIRAVATIRNGPLGVDAERASRLDALLSGIDRAKNINGLVGTDMLDAVRQEAGKILGKASDQSKLAYGPARNEIANAIERVAPGYLDYLATYSKASEPINTMESVRALADPNAPGSLNAGGDPQLTAGRLKTVLRGDDKARYPMSSQARGELEAIRQSLARRSISDDKLAASGPATAADLQAQTALSRGLFGNPVTGKPGALTRALGSTLGAGLGTFVGHPVIGAAIGSALPEAVQKVNGRVASRIGTTAADARATAEAIVRALSEEQKSAGPSKVDQLLFGGNKKLSKGDLITRALMQQSAKR